MPVVAGKELNPLHDLHTLTLKSPMGHPVMPPFSVSEPQPLYVTDVTQQSHMVYSASLTSLASAAGAPTPTAALSKPPPPAPLNTSLHVPADPAVNPSTASPRSAVSTSLHSPTACSHRASDAAPRDLDKPPAEPIAVRTPSGNGMEPSPLPPPATGATSLASPTAAATLGPDSKRVLLVEDHPINAKVAM
jgi:hypothetical protein